MEPKEHILIRSQDLQESENGKQKTGVRIQNGLLAPMRVVARWLLPGVSLAQGKILAGFVAPKAEGAIRLSPGFQPSEALGKRICPEGAEDQRGV